MKTIKWLFPIASLFLMTGCWCFDDDTDVFGCEKGVGTSVEEEIFVAPFSGIDIDIAADVYITQGDEHEVVVRGEQNIIDLLDRDVKNGIWEIDFEHCVRRYDELDVYITIPNLDYLKISGSGSIRGQNVFLINDIEVLISGSGDVHLELEADDVEGKISGSGQIELEGLAETLDFKISGSGDLKAFDLPVQRAKIQISGSGDAEVHVLDELDVRVSGSGDIYYIGNPAVDAVISGSGRVIDVN
ncbi:MAG: DUF2807 domain-containing protein [Bacteroidetes bacterium]|nr:DUF2807 domain-containing protein [Bacteroidota bacterium]